MKRKIMFGLVGLLLIAVGPLFWSIPTSASHTSPETLRRLMAESWCAHLTGYKMNSIAVDSTRDGMLGKETAHQLCARVGLKMAAKLPAGYKGAGGPGRCIKGSTRIESPNETFYYRSFYWSRSCNETTASNGHTYVCCVLH